MFVVAPLPVIHAPSMLGVVIFWLVIGWALTSITCLLLSMRRFNRISNACKAALGQSVDEYRPDETKHYLGLMDRALRFPAWLEMLFPPLMIIATKFVPYKPKEQ
jgi:hypothetical protein